MTGNKIKVKVLSRVREIEWQRYFPNQVPEWGDCRFLFAPEERNYDWLVVYNDIPPKDNERFSRNEEVLACPADNTLLITYEPPTVKIYGKEFTSQFAHVLTSQEEWALPHRSRIYSQPALHWFYGRGKNRLRSWREMYEARPDKTRTISSVCASKQHKTGLHKRRDPFVRRLQAVLPELDIYGRGVRPIDDKAEAIDAYYHHLTVENHLALHHWTEKLSDSFLGLALPLYAGCPNAADYFPEESFVPIDIFQEEEALATISKVIRDREYSSRQPAILEARRRVLEEYNFFAVVSEIIKDRHQTGKPANVPVRSRRAILIRSPAAAIGQLMLKLRARLGRGYG